MNTVPPSYSRRRGMGDALPPAATPTADAPPLVGEVVDSAPAQSDMPQNAPPSTYAVADVLDGADGSIVRLAGLTLLRTGFIIPGIWAANRVSSTEMGFGKLLGYSLATSTSISLGMLGYYALKRRFPRRTQGAT